MFLPFGGEFSLQILDDNVDRAVFSESLFYEFVPQNTFVKNETNINVTNINVRGNNPRGNNFRGNNNRGNQRRKKNVNKPALNECDTVKVHVNNLQQCVTDHLKSQKKKGYYLKKIKEENGNYKVITENEARRKFIRYFNVIY